MAAESKAGAGSGKLVVESPLVTYFIIRQIKKLAQDGVLTTEDGGDRLKEVIKRFNKVEDQLEDWLTKFEELPEFAHDSIVTHVYEEAKKWLRGDNRLEWDTGINPPTTIYPDPVWIGTMIQFIGSWVSEGISRWMPMINGKNYPSMLFTDKSRRMIRVFTSPIWDAPIIRLTTKDGSHVYCTQRTSEILCPDLEEAVFMISADMVPYEKGMEFKKNAYGERAIVGYKVDIPMVKTEFAGDYNTLFGLGGIIDGTHKQVQGGVIKTELSMDEFGCECRVAAMVVMERCCARMEKIQWVHLQINGPMLLWIVPKFATKAMIIRQLDFDDYKLTDNTKLKSEAEEGMTMAVLRMEAPAPVESKAPTPDTIDDEVREKATCGTWQSTQGWTWLVRVICIAINIKLFPAWVMHNLSFKQLSVTSKLLIMARASPDEGDPLEVFLRRSLLRYTATYVRTGDHARALNTTIVHALPDTEGMVSSIIFHATRNSTMDGEVAPSSMPTVELELPNLAEYKPREGVPEELIELGKCCICMEQCAVPCMFDGGGCTCKVRCCFNCFKRCDRCPTCRNDKKNYIVDIGLMLALDDMPEELCPLVECPNPECTWKGKRMKYILDHRDSLECNMMS